MSACSCNASDTVALTEWDISRCIISGAAMFAYCYAHAPSVAPFSVRLPSYLTTATEYADVLFKTIELS